MNGLPIQSNTATIKSVLDRHPPGPSYKTNPDVGTNSEIVIAADYDLSSGISTDSDAMLVVHEYVG
jgi:hypothetical protein